MPIELPPADDSPYEGQYTTTQDVYDEGGQGNVEEFARLAPADGSPEIEARVERAIKWSEAYMNDWMRNAGKAIPLVSSTPTDNAAEVATILNAVTAKLALVYLYRARGQNDVQDPETDDSQTATRSQMRSKEQEANAQLSFWARPTDTTLALASGVPSGGGAGSAVDYNCTT